MDRSEKHLCVFDESKSLVKRNTCWTVVRTAITLAALAAEITGGWLVKLMALLADGWHMSRHVATLGLSGLARIFARCLAAQGRTRL